MPTHASVVFLRIHEFARRPVSEQARLRAQLEAVIAVTVCELEPESRIVLDASDAVCLVVLADPVGALRLAERALASAAAGLPLCAGLNHGAVRLVKGSDGEMLLGDGIAVAASVARFAAPAHLRASRSFRDALAAAVPGDECMLVPKGSSTDPGLRTHELFGLDRTATRRRARRYFAVSLATALLLVAAAVGVRVTRDGEEALVNAVTAKYAVSRVQGERYLRGVIDRVRFRFR